MEALTITPLRRALEVLVMFLVVILVGVFAFAYGKHVQNLSWQDTIKTYKAKVAQADADARTQIAAATAENALQVASMHAQLEAALAKQAQVKVITKEVTKYVTQHADASAVIPAGFVWVFNRSLDGEVPTGGLPGSGQFDVDAPSGVALSTVAEVAADNNAECVVRGKVVQIWQNWYSSNRQRFDALKVAMPEVPVIPDKAN